MAPLKTINYSVIFFSKNMAKELFLQSGAFLQITEEGHFGNKTYCKIRGSRTYGNALHKEVAYSM
jgi:hypothetical protein